jgi:hypothetical protein
MINTNSLSSSSHASLNFISSISYCYLPESEAVAVGDVTVFVVAYFHLTLNVVNYLTLADCINELTI